MKVVLDTNVFLSGVFFGGVPGRLLQAWRDRRLNFVLSVPIFSEYQRAGQRLAERFRGVNLERLLLEAMGSAGLPGAAETGNLPRPGLEYRQVSSRAVASESEPGTRDRTAYAVLRGAGAAEPGEGMNLLLNPPNRRIRDPYVRWRGRRGVARLLPIPISRMDW